VGGAVVSSLQPVSHSAAKAPRAPARVRLVT
jgi:hypothetical protein